VDALTAIMEKRPMAYGKSTDQQVTAAAKKAERERDGSLAMQEYQAEKTRVDANTARLRALRLEKEAAEAQAAAAKAAEAPAKSKSRPKKAAEKKSP